MPRSPVTVDRRQFLFAASASAAAFNWHDVWARAGVGQDDVRAAAETPRHRIRSLRLHTAAPLEQMARYYKEVLGLPVNRPQDGELTVIAGQTPLTYVAAADDEQTPWYHVAFDIPENKLFLAREWLLERTKLKLRRPGPTTHPEFPEVANFDHWNAHSTFFWDPAGNLLEYIARHTLDNAADGPFTPKDVLHVSEIGIMSDDMKTVARAVGSELGLPDYIGVNDHFHPLGDHHGLVIGFPSDRPWRMSDGSTRPTKPYFTNVTLSGDRDHTFKVPDHPFSFRVKAAESK